MPRKAKNTIGEVRWIVPQYDTKEEAEAARLRGENAVVEFVKALARMAADRDHREFLEFGEHRFMSSDPNVDWAAHDARWAARDAAAELQREQEAAAEAARKKEARRQKSAKAIHEAAAAELQEREEQAIGKANLPLERRLQIADEMAAKHAGQPISKKLLELFPELSRPYG